MYNLYKISDNLYQIHSSYRTEKAMEGTMVAIVTYCVAGLRFNVTEIEDAMVDMIHKETDAAHFGINRKFLYSFNRTEKKAG